MKAITLIPIFIILSSWFAYAEKDPFGDTKPDPTRPNRKITKIPKSIKHKKGEDGIHRYIISGIYSGSQKSEIQNPGDLYEASIPACDDCKLDFNKLTCTIRTTRELTNSELAYAIDDIAKMGGDLPYWVELEARDIVKTIDFTNMDFSVEKIKGKHSNKLGWFTPSKDRSFQIPYSVGQEFKILIVPTTAYCMCHSRFCIRILDPSGKVVWKNEAIAFGGFSLALSDQDEDLIQEILIRCYDHGKDTHFIIKPKANKIE